VGCYFSNKAAQLIIHR